LAQKRKIIVFQPEEKWFTVEGTNPLELVRVNLHLKKTLDQLGTEKTLNFEIDLLIHDTGC
jgi:hypothetical protein